MGNKKKIKAMENKKQTYLEWFKEKYQFGWVIAIIVLHTFFAIKLFLSEVPSDGWIPTIFGASLLAIIFGLSFYQYKKGDDTRFR